MAVVSEVALSTSFLIAVVSLHREIFALNLSDNIFKRGDGIIHIVGYVREGDARIAVFLFRVLEVHLGNPLPCALLDDIGVHLLTPFYIAKLQFLNDIHNKNMRVALRRNYRNTRVGR